MPAEPSETMMRVLVTGAGGFIGHYVVRALAVRGYRIRAALRQPKPQASPEHESVVIGDINAHTNWQPALEGVDAILHLAGRAHILRETSASPLEAFRAVNTVGTLRLAHMAQTAGVKRFVFVSTIGVNGDETRGDQRFTEESPAQPQTPYAISKWEAEQGLQQFHNLGVVIVRPPLVYGIDAPGNFAQLLRFIRSGLPLPFASTTNQRSLIAAQNLADFLIACIEHERAAGETFLVSDDEAFSTAQLLRRVGEAIGKRPLLLPFPPPLLRAGLSAIGKQRMAAQLLGSLLIDSSKARRLLGWQPPFTMQQALKMSCCACPNPSHL